MSALCFKSEWHNYILSLISSHQKNSFSPVIITPSVPSNVETTDSDIRFFFLPEVIVWDPISQFPALFVNSQPFLCIEPKCNQEMKFVAWQDGSSQRLCKNDTCRRCYIQL